MPSGYYGSGDPSKVYARLIKRQTNGKPRASKYRGVSPNRSAGGAWKASVCFKGRRYYIGIFQTEEEAALAYNKKALEVIGDGPWLNEVDLPLGHS